MTNQAAVLLAGFIYGDPRADQRSIPRRDVALVLREEELVPLGEPVADRLELRLPEPGLGSTEEGIGDLAGHRR